MERFQSLAALIPNDDTALLITSYPAVRYYLGERTPEGTILLAWKQEHLAFSGLTRPETLSVIRHALPQNIRQIEIEPDAMTVGDLQRLSDALAPLVLLPSADLQTRIFHQRQHKEPGEIAKIRQAQAITDRAFLDMLNHIHEGMTDRELQKLIADLLFKHGSEMTSFNHVVGCGSATDNPHVRPSGRVLRRGDFIMVDIGALVEGYGSDMTRMIALGTPDERKQMIFDLVLRAQSAGLAAAKAGAVCREVDAAARAVIEQAGFGAFFPHGLGHPVGSGGWEGPRFSPTDSSLVPTDIVMTVEPGVYLPGEFGVRMEDMVLIRADQTEDLTGVPRELFIV